ncbi:MAG: porin [Nitrospinae bacterium]|nr:porin [Nitrospinota bacterium]
MSEEKIEVEFKPKLTGYVEGWYRSDESDLSTQTSASKKVNNEFRVRRARIDVRGNVTEEIGYRIQGSFDGPAPASGSASVRLWDAYMTYKAHSLINITMGQFKYPFTLEGLEGIPDIIPVLRADSITDIAGKLGTQGGSYRDIGIMVNGGYKDALGLTYGVAIINGKGINTGDNNRGKDIVGRVTLSPLDGLTLGGSYYRGKGQDETETLEVNESAYDLEAEFRLKELGFSMRGEYITAEWENWDAAQGKAVSGKRQKPNGWYIQMAYRLPPLTDLQLLARYEDYEKDGNTPDSHLKTTTVGVTYYFKGKTRVTANYLIRDAQDSSIVTAQETDAAGHRIDNLFLIQMIVVF